MADVERTTTAVLALLADNQQKKISPQDHRDEVVSVLGGYGSIRVFDGSAAFVANIAPAKLTSFTANGPSLGGSSPAVVPDQANDRITANLAANYEIAFHASYTAPAGRTIQFRIRVDGAEVSVGCQGGGGSEPISASCRDVVTISPAPTSQIEVYVEADQNATSPRMLASMTSQSPPPSVSSSS